MNVSGMKEKKAKVYTPDRRLIAIGTLSVGSDRAGTFTPDPNFQPPHYKLDLGAKPTVFAEVNSTQYELQNWTLQRFFLGSKLRFEFIALFDRIRESASPG